MPESCLNLVSLTDQFRALCANTEVKFMSKADEFREQAKEAGERASQSKSFEKAAIQRRRQKGLTQLADNEDWLEGKESVAQKL